VVAPPRDAAGRRAGATLPETAVASDPSPVLAGDALRLRPLGPADAALYLRLYTDAGLMRGLGGALSASAAQRSFAIACTTGGAGVGVRRWWTILPAHEASADAAGLGLAGLEHDPHSGELGVLVAPPHQGAGVARRALRLLARHAFDQLGLARLHIRHDANNAAMAAVAARLGFDRVDAHAATGPAQDWLWTRSAPARPAG
jgi:RimJ/RimL family protein N-acetyltransferase